MNYTLTTTGGGIGTDSVNMNFNNAILKNDTYNLTVASFGSTNSGNYSLLTGKTYSLFNLGQGGRNWNGFTGGQSNFAYSAQATLSQQVVPEPASMIALSLGIGSMLRRKR